MSESKPITFVVATNKVDVLQSNFLASPFFLEPHPHQILVQERFTSAAAAYNDAIDKSVNDLIVFCHQDIFFPELWVSQLREAIGHLDSEGSNWGVLGCSGITRGGSLQGCVYSSGVGIIGTPSEPAPVQTLDEIVLIIRKSSGLRFDPALPHFHLYGSDLCLRARSRGMKSYAISAFCIHNTHQSLILPQEFYECCRYMRRVWIDALPIQTTCVRITKFNIPLYKRRLREFYLQHIRRKTIGGTRSSDVRQILEELSGAVEILSRGGA